MNNEFIIVIEQDEDGIYITSVPELERCYTQVKNLGIQRKRNGKNNNKKCEDNQRGMAKIN